MIYITRQMPEAGVRVLTDAGYTVKVNKLDRPLSRDELLTEVQDAEAVITLLTDRVDSEVFDVAGHAKGFANYAVGYDNMDVAEATKRGIPLTNTPGVLTDATADMAWALLFSIARRVVESDAFMRAGKWRGWGPLQFIGGDISGKTLGIVGAGRIGSTMALKSRGFGMTVLYADDRTNEVLESEIGADRVSLDRLLAESDYVSVHVPLLDSTRHLIDGEALARMKPSAYLINTARGPVIDEIALVTALRDGVIAGAGLDVYESEPIAAPGLAQLDNVVMTPHIASATRETRDAMATMAAHNAIAMVEGRRPETCINPEVYT